MDLRQLRDGLEQARQDGAHGAEFLFERVTGNVLDSARGKVTDGQVGPDETLTITVWLEGGRVASRAGAVEKMKALLSGALSAAKKSPVDAHAGPLQRQQTVLGGLGIADRRYENVLPEDRLEILTSAERAVRQVDRRLVGSDFGYRDEMRVRRFANSRGVFLEETDTTYLVRGTVRASVGRDEIVLSERSLSRTFASIAALPYGTTLARRLVDLMQPAVALSGPVRTLLPPLAVAQLVAAIAEHFAASSFADGADYFLQPRADGKPVLDPRIHLQDDGTLPGGLRSASFDDRGACPVPLTLLREGAVDGRFVSPTAAHALDARATGHEVAGTQRPRNLLLRTGTRSMNAVLADLGGRVFRIDQFECPPGEPLGLVGLDPTTGLLECRVHGVVYDNNRAVGAVRNARLRGGLLNVFSNLVEVCSDTDRFDHVDAPGMVVDGFTIDP